MVARHKETFKTHSKITTIEKFNEMKKNSNYNYYLYEIGFR